MCSSDLAGVLAGVLLSGVFFTAKVAGMLEVQGPLPQADGSLRWQVGGQVFFASAEALVEAFDVRSVAGQPVTIDASGARFWDITAVGALDKVVQRLRQHGCSVDVQGLDVSSQRLIDRLRV